jgi:hypothetical protein
MIFVFRILSEPQACLEQSKVQKKAARRKDVPL